MKEYDIGGYFGLELLDNGEFHKNAIRLNTGRNALEYILQSNRYKKNNYYSEKKIRKH